MCNSNSEIIDVGDYIIIQRQKYTKVHKFSSVDSIVILGKDKIKLNNIEGKPYCTTFKMIPTDTKNKIYELDNVSEIEMRNIREKMCIIESGQDNRNIIDDSQSQGLKTEDIAQLREDGTGCVEILEKIVENSKTFNSKTEYAQEKYLKKKEKKYFEFIQIKKPTIRLLCEIYYRQDPDKVMGIRMDTLSQIISYTGISCFGNHLLYESGTNGLLPATYLNSIGSKTDANIIHMHPGNEPQKQAILALNLPLEQSERCISVNIYSILRECYQNTQTIEIQNSEKDNIETCIPEKKIKLDNDIEEKRNFTADSLPKWKIENYRASKILKNKVDSLLIASREHPSNILNELLPFLKPSRPIVIFNLSREILMEIYVDLKASSNVTGLHLTSNWLRMYQVLPNRTHPEVSMSGNSGYLLWGITVS